MKSFSFLFLWIVALLLLTPTDGWAWGRHGHSLICQMAAYLAAGDHGGEGLKAHAYDLGYYCNVPDFVWKKPATYEVERVQHYMDIDLFEKAFAKRPEVKSPLGLSRADFDKQFPELSLSSGRAWWRMRELNERMHGFSEQLSAADSPRGKERHVLQKKWLVTAGVLGHYVGDMSMPLHVTENHDGQATQQRGIHFFFEDVCVNEIYPSLQDKVWREARGQWPAFAKKNSNRYLPDMLIELVQSSFKSIPQLLAIDKANPRSNIKVACKKFEPLIIKRLVASTLVLGEMYRREFTWTMDDDRFYLFDYEPEYIAPGKD